jgi:hypothetical protein
MRGLWLRTLLARRMKRESHGALRDQQDRRGQPELQVQQVQQVLPDLQGQQDPQGPAASTACRSFLLEVIS